MAQKKDDDESKDLTRIEDLSEFLHEQDSELDSRFEDFVPKNIDLTNAQIETEAEAFTSLVELEDLPPDLPNDDVQEQVDFDFSLETPSEIAPEVEAHDFDAHSSDLPTDFLDETTESVSEEIVIEDQFEISEELKESSYFDQADDDEFLTTDSDLEKKPPTLVNTSEKFEDVKIFAHNFSYGKSSGIGGNPPFSIIARNIRYEEDADSIVDLLEEFGVITPNNEKDIKTSLSLGTLLIPQISEYMAIVIAHKLRRFDLDLEVGLSDEVHPSKSGETNPRGLIKKGNLKQNKLLQVKLDEIEFKIKDIILTTSNNVDGYNIDRYLGIESCFAVVDEKELERLNFIQKSKRDSSDFIEYIIDEDDSKSAEIIFKEYQESFSTLYDDLKSQLRQKALFKQANALLGLSFQLSPVQFDKDHQRYAAYHITCTATLASISKKVDSK